MSDWDPQVSSDEAGGQCRIHIPDNEQQMRPHLTTERLEAFDHLGDLKRIGLFTNRKFKVRMRQIDIGEVLLVQFTVVMLTRMDEYGMNRGKLAHLPKQRRNLDEIRPCSDH